MHRPRFRVLAFSACTFLLAACGTKSHSNDSQAQASSSSGPHLSAFEKRLKVARLPPGIGDAMSAAVASPDVVLPDHAGYPAFTPNLPTIVNQGGPTLRAPRIVTITWDGDPNRDVYAKFGDEIGKTSYWRDTTSEYGIGPAVSGPENHVHISQPLGTISDQDLDTLVRTNVVNAPASGWPVTDDQTLYTLYLPANALTFGGEDACNTGIGGYHTDSPLSLDDGGSSKVFNYAVNINCPAKWDVHTVTLISSHEIIEASTDPFPSSNTGYVGFDGDHLAFDIFQQFQDETGDACEFFRSSDYVGGSSFPFGLQRTWSNKSAKLGHNPCVPRTRLPYFNVTTFPEEMQQVTVDFTSVGGPKVQTKGYTAALNQPTTFTIGFYSDAPTNADWTVWPKVPATVPGMTDNDGNPLANGEAVTTLDKPSGHNGHKAQVTITPTKLGPLGALYLELHSTLQGGEERIYPVLLAPN